jgi:hypothetical protein
MDDAGRHATLGLDTACANVPVPLDARRGPLQHCIVCMRHDVAMIAKARGPTTAFIQDHWVSIFSACAFAAHSSLQEVSEVRVRMGVLCLRRGRIGWWKWLASALRLCYKKATEGVWRMRIDCARIFIVCKNNNYSSIAVPSSTSSLSTCARLVLTSRAFIRSLACIDFMCPPLELVSKGNSHHISHHDSP